MQEFQITIEETVTGSFKVVANTNKEAIKIAIEKYKNGEFVNEPGEIEERRIASLDVTGHLNAWENF